MLLVLGCGRIGFDPLLDSAGGQAGGSGESSAEGGSGLGDPIDFQPSVTYYVAADGDDANPGTEALPLLTLQHAADQSGPGTRVIVGSGSFDGFAMVRTGEVDNPIHFVAGGDVVITTPDGSTAAIELAGVGHIWIQGFFIDALQDGIRHTAPEGGLGSRIRVIGNGITAGQYGVSLSDTSECEVSGNLIRFGVRGVYLFGSGHDGCVVANNTIDAVDVGTGIINEPVANGSPKTSTSNVTITGNHFDGAAIVLDGLEDSRIDNNVFLGRAGTITLWSWVGPGPSNVEIVNNTVYTQDTNAALALVGGLRPPITVFNNALFTRGPSILLDSAEWRDEVVSAANAMNDEIELSNPSITIERLTWWTQAESTSPSFSVMANQEMNNGGEPSEGSELVDRGISQLGGVSAPTIDRDGVSRPARTAYDIGALELP